jgi:hypothetical protein
MCEKWRVRLCAPAVLISLFYIGRESTIFGWCGHPVLGPSGGPVVFIGEPFDRPECTIFGPPR